MTTFAMMSSTETTPRNKIRPCGNPKPIFDKGPGSGKNLVKKLASLLLLVVLTVGAQENVETSRTKGRLYSPSDDAMQDVKTALGRAQETGTLALIVLGANWCHDSRALASRLYQKPLATLIKQHYETVFVDVGYVDKGMDVIDYFGVPGYYATPTVLIIDPGTGHLVNTYDRHRWRNAYNITMEESVAYFQEMASGQDRNPAGTGSVEEARLKAEIDAFENQMAQRVREGYAAVSPLLKVTVESSKPSNFDLIWDEVSEFRMTFTEDLERLRNEARRRVIRGETGVELEFPTYPPFSWLKDVAKPESP